MEPSDPVTVFEATIVSALVLGLPYVLAACACALGVWWWRRRRVR